MSRRSMPRILLWVSHAAVLVATLLGIASTELEPLGRVALAVLAAAPLLAAVPGLRHSRRATYQWLTVALVLYIGVASVEVVATLGEARFSAVALFAALLELGVLLYLIRAPDRVSNPPPATPRE